MKSLFHCIVAASLMQGAGSAAETISFTNYIRQYQMPSTVTWDASTTIQTSGSQLSELAINPGGARFEMWTMKSSSVSGLSEYLLDSQYVGTYVPVATVVVRSEDGSSTIPRTRADRPFYVDITVDGLLSGEDDPEPSKSVKFLRHVQSYGVGGTGVGIDRTQATLLTQTSITTNGTQNLTFQLNSVPGADRSKIRGEERFSAFSLKDYQAPESQLSSQFIQIWPVADGTISGISSNQLIRFAIPTVTLTLNDLYPNSTTYAQVYPGNQQLGKAGKVIPGSGLVINDSVPHSRTLTLSDYDKVFDSEGRWTMEIVTVTPFGTDRLAYVSFDVDRTIKMNSILTTID